MKMGLYVVYDRVAEESLRVWESRNDGTALRAYQKGMLEDKDVPEEDMMLLCVGSIDHNLNKIEAEFPAREVYVRVGLAEDKDEQGI